MLWLPPSVAASQAEADASSLPRSVVSIRPPAQFKTYSDSTRPAEASAGVLGSGYVLETAGPSAPRSDASTAGKLVVVLSAASSRFVEEDRSQVAI